MQSFQLTSRAAQLALLAAILPASHTMAQPPVAAPRMEARVDEDAQVRAFWTPERMLAAKNMDLRPASAPHLGASRQTVRGAQQIFHGAMPTVAYDAEADVLLPARPAGTAKVVHPNLVGSSHQPFTTNNLYPAPATALYYPYTAVGHLYFSIGNSGYQCSASVIRNSVIATAGHCVADGKGNFYSNWMFIPADNGSHGPFGVWTWAQAQTSSAWWSGGGTVPNEQDDALIVLKQNVYKKVLHHIGEVTGYFGYQYNAPQPTAISQLGYPCNLNSCGAPVATYSSISTGSNNTFLWGTASQGGSSGGPEVQDFGVAPSGVPSETLGGNIVIGSTSYDYPGTTLDIEGASIFYAPGQNGEFTFGDLINSACSTAGNC